jgi:hypothetical protein
MYSVKRGPLMQPQHAIHRRVQPEVQRSDRQTTTGASQPSQMQRAVQRGVQRGVQRSGQRTTAPVEDRK